MIPSKYWFKVPSDSVLNALPELKWRPRSERSAASETAALMVYVSLIFHSVAPTSPAGGEHISAATYDELRTSTSLSRKLVAAGLSRLVELNLIKPTGSHQKRRYVMVWQGATGFWFKLPCQTLVRDQIILPFSNFTLRSKYELHAMKLYLYLAARRPNEKEFSQASYETIHERIGIPERDIRKAISLLLGVGLLRSVNRERDPERKGYGPNQYFLTGGDSLRGRERYVD